MRENSLIKYVSQMSQTRYECTPFAVKAAPGIARRCCCPSLLAAIARDVYKVLFGRISACSPTTALLVGGSSSPPLLPYRPLPALPFFSHIMSTRRHPASLLPISAHNPRLLRLVRERVTYDMVIFVAEQVIRALPLVDDPEPLSGALLTPPHTPLKKTFAGDVEDSPLPKLHDFIASIVDASHVQVPVLLCTVLFLERLRTRLPDMAKGMHRHYSIYYPVTHRRSI